MDRPALTAAAYVPDPFGGEAGARLYRSGDLARYLPDGSIEFVGRVDDQIESRGVRIEPEMRSNVRNGGRVGCVPAAQQEPERGERQECQKDKRPEEGESGESAHATASRRRRRRKTSAVSEPA